MTIKQTAGRDALGDFAPKFAQLNDDVLFGEVWSREGELSLRDRSVVTVVALMAQGLTDSSFQYHLMSAKNNGVTRDEIAEIEMEEECFDMTMYLDYCSHLDEETEQNMKM